MENKYVKGFRGCPRLRVTIENTIVHFVVTQHCLDKLGKLIQHKDLCDIRGYMYEAITNSWVVDKRPRNINILLRIDHITYK